MDCLCRKKKTLIGQWFLLESNFCIQFGITLKSMRSQWQGQKRIPRHAAKYEAGEENRIVHESFPAWLCSFASVLNWLNLLPPSNEFSVHWTCIPAFTLAGGAYGSGVNGVCGQGGQAGQPLMPIGTHSTEIHSCLDGCFTYRIALFGTEFNIK